MPDKADKAQQLKLNRARAEIGQAVEDLRYLAVHTSDLYAGRRAKELLNTPMDTLDSLRGVLSQLRKDFEHLATATANAKACGRRDSLQQLLDTF